MNDSFLGVYSLHGGGIGGGGQHEARAIAEFCFFRRSKLRSCLLGLDETKTEEKLARRRRQIISMTILAFNFSAVVESVLEGSNGWQQLRRFKKVTLRVTGFEADRKKTK